MSTPFIPVPKTAQVQIVFTQQGQRVENVLHVTGAADFDVAALTAIYPDIHDWWNAAGKGMASNTVQPVLCIATAMHSASAPGIETDMSGEPAGTRTSPALPMNVTAAIAEHTGLRGRSYNGRIYHVGMTADMVVGSTLTSAMIAALLGSYNYLKANMTAATRPLSIVSKRSLKAWRTTGVATVVTSLSVDATTDSQRRRLPGRGR